VTGPPSVAAFWCRTASVPLQVNLNPGSLPDGFAQSSKTISEIHAGPRGVVLKQSATDLLVKSIHRVHAGEIWLDNRMTAEVMKAFSKSRESGPRREKPLLSDREKEIVQLVAQGFRDKEIGEKLFISEQTVKNHLHNIFDKLGVSDRLELALYAIHHRLTDQS
jgi:DNA-binding NarL/FixJ family response regulator